MAKKATAKSDAAVSGGGKDYTVLARRYRPQQFDDLIGQEPVAQALKNAIQSNRIAHAYLFTGVRGVGKTSTARILAKALNCAKGPTITPCDECSNCKAISVGEDTDVLEIDGASNNKVEEVRELRQNTQYRPQSSRFKIYIIDEVHMLSPSAFNALLKTLEEPPPHVKFIFATTEVNKIPITILSRCQRFDLSGISRESIKDRLKAIVKAEGHEAEDEALQLVARRAGGSMRDAQSLMDQALAFSEGKVTLDQVQKLLGLAHEEEILNIVRPVLERNPAEALKALHLCLSKNVQLGELLDQWIDLWRQLLLRATLGDTPLARELCEADLKPFSAALANWKLEALMAGMDVLVSTKTRFRSTGQTQVLLELATIRLCRLADMLPLVDIAKRLDGLAKGATRGGAMQSASRTMTAPAKPVAAPSATRQTFEMPAPSAALQLYDVEQPAALWAALLEQLGSQQISLQLGRSNRQTFVPPGALLVTFPSGSESTKDFCSDSNRSAKLEEMIKKLTGKAIALRYEVATNGAPVTVVPKAVQQRQMALRAPLAKAVMEQLAGQLVHIDDGFGG
ncbi:MAG TPA: DNA polymerase III subunit gamma/tau [Gemmatales bacterium]|nr:DNA polymerase III subunit gamma/tau [Gemmatales bacterium]